MSVSADPPRRIVTRAVAYLGLKFDVDTHLSREANGTLLQLRAETHWQGARRAFGRA